MALQNTEKNKDAILQSMACHTCYTASMCKKCIVHSKTSQHSNHEYNHQNQNEHTQKKDII